VSACVRACVRACVSVVSYIMPRTSYILMGWWRCAVCTRSTLRELDLHSIISLKQHSLHRHVAPLGHIILIPKQPDIA